MEAFWGVDWPRDITVVAAGSDDQFRAAAGGGPASQWADIAAVTVVDQVDPVHRVAVGQRIVFAPGAADDERIGTANRVDATSFFTTRRAPTPPLDAPRWLTEGVADFVARPQHAGARRRTLPLPLTLPSDADLDTPGPQRSLAYDRAWWFARFVADTYGTPKLRALLSGRLRCRPRRPARPPSVTSWASTRLAVLRAVARSGLVRLA